MSANMNDEQINHLANQLLPKPPNQGAETHEEILRRTVHVAHFLQLLGTIEHSRQLADSANEAQDSE